MTTIEIKRLLDYTNYIQQCVSKGDEINKETIRNYIKDDYFFTKL